MVDYIHGEFIRSLESVDWMDPQTKRRAILKAKGITARIGYAKEILNHVNVAELFKGVSLTYFSFSLLLSLLSFIQ